MSYVNTEETTGCVVCRPAPDARTSIFRIAMSYWTNLSSSTPCLADLMPTNQDLQCYTNCSDVLWCKLHRILEEWISQSGSGLTCEEIIDCVVYKCDLILELNIPGFTFPGRVTSFIVDGIERQIGGPSIAFNDSSLLGQYLSGAITGCFESHADGLVAIQERSKIDTLVLEDSLSASYNIVITEENCTGLQLPDNYIEQASFDPNTFNLTLTNKNTLISDIILPINPGFFGFGDVNVSSGIGTQADPWLLAIDFNNLISTDFGNTLSIGTDGKLFAS